MIGAGPAEPVPIDASYQAKVEREKEAKRRAGDVTKAKKREERHKRQAGWCRLMKQTQRFLGLRPPPQRMPPDVGAGDLGGPAAFPFESSVVFIAIDIEVMETNAKVITEIGLAALDTNNIRFVPAGLDGRGWMGKIEARHFRVAETMDHVNRRYVTGCPENFRFGTSELVSLPEALQRTVRCFTPPHHHHVTGPNLGPRRQSSDGGMEPRRVVLVGHDIQHDIKFLHRVGFDLTSLPAILHTVDTAILWRVYKREFHGRGLETILADLGLAGRDAHNAGNHAVYTRQAMVALAFRDIHPKTDLDSERAQRIEAAVQDLRDRLWDEAEGWSPSPDEDGHSPEEFAPLPHRS